MALYKILGIILLAIIILATAQGLTFELGHLLVKLGQRSYPYCRRNIFHGLIMGLLKKRWNRRITILVPSLLFASLHLIGNSRSWLSFLQLLVADSLVGIIFSLVTLATGIIWHSVLIHGCWNKVFVGSLLHLGNQADKTTLVSFVLHSKNPRDFRVEASLPAICGCLICILFTWQRFKKPAT